MYHYNGPLPTRLILFSDLANTEIGSKIRFLGCVQKYDVHTATLTLSSSGVSVNNVELDVRLLLDSLKRTDTAVGEWVNVVGYITDIRRDREKIEVCVQAVMLWSAGAVRVEEYEMAVREREELGLMTPR